jgi:hypothetical protein
VKANNVKACLTYLEEALVDLRARLPTGSKLKIRTKGNWIIWSCWGWSPTLTWTYFDGCVSFDELRDLLGPGPLARTPKGMWLPMSRPIFGQDFLTQAKRHAAAQVHGLSSGAENDLPAACMLIDRQLKLMLEAEFFDLYYVIEKLVADYWWERDTMEDGNSCGYVDYRFFKVTQDGLTLPVLSTSVALGPAKYNGCSIVMRGHMPDILCIGAAGRRLGELALTGHALLDGRFISSVVQSSERDTRGDPHDVTIIFLQPDLVEVGQTVDVRMKGSGNAFAGLFPLTSDEELF